MKKCLVRENRRLTFGGSESAHFLKLLIMYSLSGPSARKRVMSERSQHRWLAEARRMACGEGQLPGSTDQRVVRRELACYPYIKKGTEGQQHSTHRLWGTRQHAGLREESYLAYRLWLSSRHCRGFYGGAQIKLAVCVCVCVFMWVCALVYLETRCQCLSVCVCARTCTHTCVCVFMWVCAHVYVEVRSQYVYVRMCTFMWVCAHVCGGQKSMLDVFLYCSLLSF